MGELIKKYYVSRHAYWSNTIDFSIVYGTVGKKEFTVKEQDCIIGNSSDIRIPLDSPNLFDNFHKAAERFIQRNAEMREQVLETLKEIDEADKIVADLVASIPPDK